MPLTQMIRNFRGLIVLSILGLASVACADPTSGGGFGGGRPIVATIATPSK